MNSRREVFPTTVADARFAKPIDTALVEHWRAIHAVFITIEEAARGFSAVAQYLVGKVYLILGLHLTDAHVDCSSIMIPKPSSWQRPACRGQIVLAWRSEPWQFEFSAAKNI